VPSWDGLLTAAAGLYAGALDLRDPQISPIYGSFDGFPPTLLVTGTRDLLLSDTVRAHVALRTAGAVADLLVFEGMSHGDYLIAATSPGLVSSLANSIDSLLPTSALLSGDRLTASASSARLSRWVWADAVPARERRADP
jgi:acetyl esterase/lipase